MKKHLLTLCLFTIFLLAKGQDIHFSQYNGSLLNASPALTGLFDGDYRVNAIYRSQWQSVPVPYKTFSLAGDMRYKPKQLLSDCIGIGIHFNNDVAGDAYYGFNQLYVNASYLHKANKDSTLIVSGGLNFGISSVGFNYNKMTFDNQYDGFSYNSSLATGEAFSTTKAIYADLNIGVAAQYNLTKFTTLTYAFSLSHLSSPMISYQGNPMSKIDRRMANFLSVSFPINKNIYSVNEIWYSHQGKYNEFIPGTGLKFLLDEKNNNAVSFGLYLRTRDAFIARLGYNFKTTTAGISYDMNTSKFIAATNRRGAFEIYITHIIKKDRPFVAKKRVCPVFM
jgi:type IX secretion system PorP/SprF family membrane protein